MKNKIIKTWTLPSGSSEFVIRYYKDKVELVNYHHQPSLDALVSNLRPLYSPALDTELMTLIAQHQKAKDFGANAKQHFKFWKCLDLSKIPTKTYWSKAKIEGYYNYLDISPNGVLVGYAVNDNKIKSTPTRLNHLFFYGPRIPLLSLEDRKEIQSIFLEALGGTFSIKDSFSLFDYAAIPPKKWEHTAPPYGYYFIEIKEGFFIFGGGDNPRESGASICSFEQTWYDMPSKNQSFFKSVNIELEQLLEQAIIQ